MTESSPPASPEAGVFALFSAQKGKSASRRHIYININIHKYIYIIIYLCIYPGSFDNVVYPA